MARAMHTIGVMSSPAALSARTGRALATRKAVVAAAAPSGRTPSRPSPRSPSPVSTDARRRAGAPAQPPPAGEVPSSSEAKKRPVKVQSSGKSVAAAASVLEAPAGSAASGRAYDLSVQPLTRCPWDSTPSHPTTPSTTRKNRSQSLQIRTTPPPKQPQPSAQSHLATRKSSLRKAPRGQMSAASAAYLALGQTVGGRKPRAVSRNARAMSGRDDTGLPVDENAALMANNIEVFRRDLLQNRTHPPPSSESSATDECEVDSNTSAREREILERIWTESDVKKQRAGSSCTASSSSSPPSSPPARKLPFMPNRGGAVVRGRRVKKSTPAGVSKATADTVAEHSQVSAHLLETQAQVQQLSSRIKARAYGRAAGAANRKSADSMNELLEEAGSHVLLVREEETLLLDAIQRKCAVDNIAATLREEAGEEPSPDALAEAADLEGGAADLRVLNEVAIEARQTMEICNIRLVASIARKYHGQRDMDCKDLMHAGLEGLHKAFEKFDTSKGVKFSTYGHWWVRQRIVRCLWTECRVVRLPAHVMENISRITTARTRLQDSSDGTGEVQLEDIAAELKMTPRKVKDLLKLGLDPLSMEGYAYSTESQKGGDPVQLLDTLSQDDDREGLLSSSSWSPPEQEEIADELEGSRMEAINEMLETLQPRERNILRMHYGLHSSDGKEMTFGDIGEAYGLTQERIRQIEDKAVRRLRRLNVKGLEEIEGWALSQDAASAF